MGDSFKVDGQSNEQLKEFLVYTNTAPSGVKMGAHPVSITGGIPTGTNVIGRVGIDQTTPGTTNAVRMIQADNGGIPRTPQAKVLSDLVNLGHIGLLTQSLMSAVGTESSLLVDSWRNNVQNTPQIYAARTSTAGSVQQVLYNGQGITCVLYVGAKAVTTTLDVQLQVFIPATGSYETIATSGPLAAAVGTNSVVVFAPAVVDADYIAAVVAKQVRVPRQYRITVVPGDANSVTYELSTYEHAT